MPPGKGNGGKKGRSGRRSLSDEVERARVRQEAWRVTGQYLVSGDELKDRAHIAVGVVKADMAKPIIIDQSKHVHLATINVKELSDEQLAEIALGRNSGLPVRNGIESGTPNSL